MAQQSSKKVSSTPKNSSTTKRLTVAEQKELVQKYEKAQEKLKKFEDDQRDIRRLRDITKQQTKSISVFNKESLRQYMQNLGSNEQNLRNLSWYLFYRSMTYMRLCHFYANMFYLNGRSVIPQYDLVKKPDVNKTLKSYQETLDWIERMH